MNTNVSTIIVVKKNVIEPALHELQDKSTAIFEGLSKLKDYQATMAIEKAALPVYQKIYRELCRIQKAINEELGRLESLDIIEIASGPHDWVSNVTATPKSIEKVRSCLHAMTINTAIKREIFPIPALESVLDIMST